MYLLNFVNLHFNILTDIKSLSENNVKKMVSRWITLFTRNLKRLRTNMLEKEQKRKNKRAQKNQVQVNLQMYSFRSFFL